MNFRGIQSEIDLVHEAITARVPGAVSQKDYAYEFPIKDNYRVPDVMRIYTHIPVSLGANEVTSNQQVKTDENEFILEHEVSNVALIASAYGQILCTRNYGLPGKSLIDLQSTGIDAKLWLPTFAGSSAIDQEYRVMPQQILGFQYANQTGNTYKNIQSAFIGRNNVEGLHEPYLPDGPPYIYSTIEKTIAAGSQETVNITIDASKDFLLRGIIAQGIQGEGPILTQSMTMQVRNHTTGIAWVPNAMAGETGVMLENIVYLGMDTITNFPLGISPVVLGHNAQYDITLKNLTNVPITIALAFFGNHCFYEKTSRNQDIRFSENGKYFLD